MGVPLSPVLPSFPPSHRAASSACRLKREGQGGKYLRSLASSPSAFSFPASLFHSSRSLSFFIVVSLLLFSPFLSQHHRDPSSSSSSEAFPSSSSILFAEAQVVGLDLGSEFVKVALVAAGRPIEILLNNASKRKTSNAVSFADDDKRELGDEGAAQASKKPDRVFLHSNLLLGVNATDYGLPLDTPTSTSEGEKEAAHHDQYAPFQLSKNLLPSGYPHEYYPYRLYVDKHRNSLAVLARDGVYLPAELVTASMLSYIKKLATQSANVHPDTTLGCVISVPCRYSQRQRQALRDAVEIAGMNPIAFHQHSATAAVQHALDLPSNTTATKLFYDVGSSGIDVGIAHYSPVSLSRKSSSSLGGNEVLQVQMLACETVPGAGGHHLDLAIAEKMREIFEKKHPGKELRKVPRALKKLVKQAVMSKHVLSANKQTHFRVEGLHSDMDFHEPIERSHIEDMLKESGFLHKLQESLNKTLDQAGMSIENIDQVELLGGAWRVPRVQHELSRLIQQQNSGTNSTATTEVGTHLNGDEAMATGAAFIAANSTVTFRVKKILFSDITPYEYTVRIFSIAEEDDDDIQIGQGGEETKRSVKKGDQIEKTKVVIPRNGRLGSGSKTVNIRTKHDFTLQLLEDHIVLDTISVRGVSEVAENLMSQAKKAQEEAAKTTSPPEGDESHILPLPKASVVFKIDSTGVISFDRAFLTQDYAVYVPAPTTTTTTTTTTSSTASTSSSSSSSSDQQKEEPSSGDSEATASKVKRVLRQLSDVLKAETTLSLPLPLTSDQKKSLISELRAFEESDMRIHRLAEAMNRLESYIYATRSLLEDENIEKVSEESLRDELRKTLERDEDWIYDSAKTEGIEKVKQRLRELEDIIEPMKTRAQEYEARPKVIEKMNKALVDAVSRLEQISTKRPWVPQAKLDDALKFRDEVSAWWKEKLEAQKAKSDKEDPIFTKSEVHAKIKELNAGIKALENVPRPTTTTTTTSSSIPSSSDGSTSPGSETKTGGEGTDEGEKKSEEEDRDKKTKEEKKGDSGKEEKNETPREEL